MTVTLNGDSCDDVGLLRYRHTSGRITHVSVLFTCGCAKKVLDEEGAR